MKIFGPYDGQLICMPKANIDETLAIFLNLNRVAALGERRAHAPKRRILVKRQEGRVHIAG